MRRGRRVGQQKILSFVVPLPTSTLDVCWLTMTLCNVAEGLFEAPLKPVYSVQISHFR